MSGSALAVWPRRRDVKRRLAQTTSVLLLVVLGAAAFLAGRFGYSDISDSGVLQFVAPAAAALILLAIESIAVYRAVQGRSVLPVVLLGVALLGACILVGLVRYDFTGFPGW